MKYIILASLFLTGCVTYPQCYVSPNYNGGVVNWKPNPNIGENMNLQDQGVYWFGNYYLPLGNTWKCGPKGWEQGFDYPYQD
jgi:hypothetical protein